VSACAAALEASGAAAFLDRLGDQMNISICESLEGIKIFQI
jgi:hypothetical protein